MWKKQPKKLRLLPLFKKMLLENNRPICENSPNLVTLVEVVK
jgi:hypothetical protein